jgi:hypothetical protein
MNQQVPARPDGDVLNRVAIADVTGVLTTDFDLPTLLQTVANHARDGFDAYSAVIVLRDDRRSTAGDDLHIVAESCRGGIGAEPELNAAGPALSSAHDGALTMVTDLAAADDSRWPEYRQRALSAGLRGVRAYPIKVLSAPIGSMVIHTEQPWYESAKPSEFGQILANLVAIALTSGVSSGRQTGVVDSVDTVLEGTTIVATAIGIIAEYRSLEIVEARRYLTRLARAQGVTVTAHARSVVAAQNNSPGDLAATGVFSAPADPSAPPRIDT